MDKSNAARAARRRAKDAARSIVQINIRVPSLVDEALKLLAADLRNGLVLQGFVVRDPKTGRVRTVVV
jgi:hypothetical protein